MESNILTDIPPHSRQRAASAGRHYFWAVETGAGEIYYESDKDNVTIGRIPGIQVLDKLKTDPWDSIVMSNIKSAAWIPAAATERAFTVSIDDSEASHICIYRKNFHTTFGQHYIAYVLGLRWDEEMRERHVHICPPCRYIDKGHTLNFPGSVDVITEPGMPNSFQKFISNGPTQ